MSFDKPIQWHLKRSFWQSLRCILETYQAVIHNKKGDAVTARRRGRLIVEKFNDGHCWILFDWALMACQIYVKLMVRQNVGETQMTKFSTNRPVKSTLTAGQSLVKPALRGETLRGEWEAVVSGLWVSSLCCVRWLGNPALSSVYFRWFHMTVSHIQTYSIHDFTVF